MIEPLPISISRIGLQLEESGEREERTKLGASRVQVSIGVVNYVEPALLRHFCGDGKANAMKSGCIAVTLVV